ncbi:MAG: transglutaminase-like domain-containing protein [Gammaproteobacteria bacterium]
MNNHLTSLKPAPPFTLGAALLLWGWQTGFLIFAVPMAVLIESSHWVSWRWLISNREFNIISDVSGVIFFIVVVYIFSTEGAKGIFVILSIMPFILFLLLALQRYSEQGRIRMSTLFVSLRRLDPNTSPEAASEIDLSLPYILLCIVSASAGNQRGIWFFILTFVLVSLILWACRPGRYPLKIWFGMLGLAFILAYVGQGELRRAQRSLEASIIGLFDQFMWRYRDPERATTSIGTIGRLKQSDRIMLRVEPDEYRDETLLLSEASYHRYNYGVWGNADSSYTLIDPEISGTEWTITQGTNERSMKISAYMQAEIGVIPVPHGTNTIRDVAAIEINRSDYGTLMMEIREGWITYTADYRDGIPADIVPGSRDLEIADNYRPVFERLATELDLYDKPDIQAVGMIEAFFADNFEYSLTQSARYPRGRHLENFLYETRAGHCEFFATSTTLLLRALGIPARYVVGYAVNEYSPIEGQYIARSRDAHSWVMAFVDNEWVVIDTTPEIWTTMEDENASLFQPLFDLYAWVSYRISVFQARDELEEEESSNDYLLYLLIPLILILIWRLYFKQRTRQNKVSGGHKTLRSYQGGDSGLYEVIRELNRNGYVRRNGETLSAWLQRINENTGIAGLNDALHLHYRYRFDPDGFTQPVKQELAAMVTVILRDLNLRSPRAEPE